MSDILTSLRQRVQSVMPELDIQDLEINQEGLTNDVAIVNKKLVFRFAKSDANARILDDEMAILDLIRPQLKTSVPTPVYRSHGTVVYPFLQGQPLLRKEWSSMDADAQEKIGGELGTFLNTLHTTDIANLNWELPSTLAPVTHDKWLDIYQRVKEKVYPLLLKHQVLWSEELFAGVLGDPEWFNYRQALIHGDLAPYHILMHQDRLMGVIDFGVAGIGDPALDVGSLISAYGERLVQKMQVAYPALEEVLPRARFYAYAIELQWALLGIETGQTFWFTAHLGGARDIAS